MRSGLHVSAALRNHCAFLRVSSAAGLRSPVRLHLSACYAAAERALASALGACVNVVAMATSFSVNHVPPIAAAAGTQMFGLRLEPAENSVFLIHFRDLHRPAFSASHHDLATGLESRDLVVGGHGLQ